MPHAQPPPQPQKLYDESYFRTYAPRPYQRDEEWLRFFGAIAERITRDIQPKTVLDAGCAMGFLVEALRDRSVDAFGVDVSEYAIRRVRDDVRPYCWIGTIVEPFPKPYDLIVCIEVVEHLPPTEAETAVANLAGHADDILFSSTPLEYREPSHLNVRPPEYWAELFARHGCYRDVDFDASFISPWAVRFRRRQEPVHRLVGGYERRFWLLWKENVDLRHLTIEQDGELREHQPRVEKLQAAVKALEAQLETSKDLAQEHQEEIDGLHTRNQQQQAELEARASAYQQLERHLRLIQSTRSWRLMAPLRWGFEFVRDTAHRVSPSRRAVNGQLSADPEQDYQAWIAANQPSQQELNGQREAATAFSYRPLVSLLVPCYNPPPEVLRETIESVLAQTYDHWEACVVDGGSTRAGVHSVLSEYAERDSRVRITYLPQNLGISGNLNEALAGASGEFVALLDHDDLLAPNMLFEVVALLNQQPDADIIYFDEDKTSADGKIRSEPFFKPDWSPDLLISANYLMHSVIRRSVVQEGGGFDSAMDGAQDWDLLFRCVERTQRIAHIPKVLYHWRKTEASTAGRPDAKPFAFDAQLRAVENHLRRTGIEQARATMPEQGYIRVLWPARGSRVSIIIPTKDNVEMLRRCVSSMTRLTTYPSFEIVIVDTGSTETRTLQYYASLKHDARVRIVEYPPPFNYSAANNLGATEATGDLLLFLNNDVEVLAADWLEELVRWAERPEIGAVGAKLLHADGTIQHAGVVIGLEGHASHVFWGARERHAGPFGSVEWYRDYLAVTGACLMVRRQVFAEVGRFDEQYSLVFSDVELCLRIARQGYRVVYTPFARLLHHEGASRGDQMPAKDIQRAYLHLRDLVTSGDPFFNPNLSSATRLPSVRRENEESRAERLRRLVTAAERKG